MRLADLTNHNYLTGAWGGESIPILTVNERGAITAVQNVDPSASLQAKHYELISGAVLGLQEASSAIVNWDGLMGAKPYCYLISNGKRIIPSLVQRLNKTLVFSISPGSGIGQASTVLAVVGRNQILLANKIITKAAISNAQTDGLLINLQFSSPVNDILTAGDFVVYAQGVALGLSSVAQSESKVSISLSNPVNQDSLVTINFSGSLSAEPVNGLAVSNLSNLVDASTTMAPLPYLWTQTQAEAEVSFDQILSVYGEGPLWYSSLVQVLKTSLSLNKTTLALNIDPTYIDFSLDFLSGLQALISLAPVEPFTISFYGKPKLLGITGSFSEILVNTDKTLEPMAIDQNSFKVAVNGSYIAVDSAIAQGNSIKLILTGLTCYGIGLNCSDIVKVSYQQPSWGKVRRLLPNSLDDIYLEPFNDIVAAISDSSGPELIDQSIDGRVITLVFDTALSGELPAAKLLVVKVDGLAHGIQSYLVNGNALSMTIDEAVEGHSIVTLAYTAPGTCCTNRLKALLGTQVSNFNVELKNLTKSPLKLVSLTCGGEGNDANSLVKTYSNGSVEVLHRSDLCTCQVAEQGCGLLGQNPTTNVLIWNTGRIDKFTQSAICGYVAPEAQPLLPPIPPSIVQEGCGLLQQNQTTYVVQWSDGRQDNMQLDSRCYDTTSKLTVSNYSTTASTNNNIAYGIITSDQMQSGAIPGVNVPNICGPCYGCSNGNCSKCYGDCIAGLTSQSNVPHYGCYNCSPSVDGTSNCLACTS